jgi:hypothetical protein
MYDKIAIHLSFVFFLGSRIVLGASNIKGNKKGDRLARMGSDSYFGGPEP